MQGVVQAIESLKNPEWFIWVQVAGVIIIPIVLSLALLCQNNKNNKNNEKLLKDIHQRDVKLKLLDKNIEIFNNFCKCIEVLNHNGLTESILFELHDDIKQYQRNIIQQQYDIIATYNIASFLYKDEKTPLFVVL